MAEAYSLHFKENVKRSVATKIAKGEHPGLSPIGYLNQRSIGTRGDIILDPTRAPIVKKLFQIYSTGTVSLNELVKIAADWGLTNKTRLAPRLNKRQIHHIISNPFYYGLAQWGGVKYEHRYPRLIDKALWDKCNMIMHCREKSSGQ